MKTFEEYQILAARVPVSLRNNLDRINLPILGLQAEAGKLGSVLANASASGRFNLTHQQRNEVRDRLADIVWYVALLCSETGMPLQEGLHMAWCDFRRD